MKRRVVMEFPEPSFVTAVKVAATMQEKTMTQYFMEAAKEKMAREEEEEGRGDDQHN